MFKVRINRIRVGDDVKGDISDDDDDDDVSLGHCEVLVFAAGGRNSLSYLLCLSLPSFPCRQASLQMWPPPLLRLLLMSGEDFDGFEVAAAHPGWMTSKHGRC